MNQCQRIIACCGKSSLLWSDNGSNFVGAVHQLKDLFAFLYQRETHETVSRFCSSQSITWKFIPEHAPHFGGLWKAAVRALRHSYTQNCCRCEGDFRRAHHLFSLDRSVPELQTIDAPACMMLRMELKRWLPAIFWLVVLWRLYLTPHCPFSRFHCFDDGNSVKHLSDTSWSIGWTSICIN